MIAAAILAALLLSVLAYGFLIYNGLVSLRNQVSKDWSNIDVLLKQRHDEIPRLVECCKGYMHYEQDLLQHLMEARNPYGNSAHPRDLAKMDERIRSHVASLYAVVENYPDLAANTLFIKLQARITQLEEAIADRREFYNHRVTGYNTRLQSVPDMFLARWFEFETKQWFSLTDPNERHVPRVSLR